MTPRQSNVETVTYLKLIGCVVSDRCLSSKILNLPQHPCALLWCPEVPHASLGTMILAIISFDFRGQNVVMYVKNWTLGVFLKCHLLLFFSTDFLYDHIYYKQEKCGFLRELNAANI